MPPPTATRVALRLAIGAATRAPAGRALTTAAATSGSCPHPSIISTTARKRAPDQRGRDQRKGGARDPARGAGRVALGRAGSSRAGAGARKVAAIAAAASGTWAMKIARQSKAWVSAPPSAGPTAAPITPAAPQSDRPARRRAAQGTEERHRARQQHGRAGALDRSGGDQDGQAVGDRAAHAGGAEDDEPPARQPRRVQPADERDQREGEDRDGDVVGRHHPRDRRDRGPEVAEQLRQRQDDDRRVGERHRHRQRQQPGRPRDGARGPSLPERAAAAGSGTRRWRAGHRRVVEHRLRPRTGARSGRYPPPLPILGRSPRTGAPATRPGPAPARGGRHRGADHVAAGADGRGRQRSPAASARARASRMSSAVDGLDAVDGLVDGQQLGAR